MYWKNCALLLWPWKMLNFISSSKHSGKELRRPLYTLYLHYKVVIKDQDNPAAVFAIPISVPLRRKVITKCFASFLIYCGFNRASGFPALSGHKLTWWYAFFIVERSQSMTALNGPWQTHHHIRKSLEYTTFVVSGWVHQQWRSKSTVTIPIIAQFCFTHDATATWRVRHFRKTNVWVTPNNWCSRFSNPLNIFWPDTS